MHILCYWRLEANFKAIIERVYSGVVAEVVVRCCIGNSIFNTGSNQSFKEALTSKIWLPVLKRPMTLPSNSEKWTEEVYPM